MAYAKYNGRVTDANGNLVLDPIVDVRRMAVGFPRVPIFSDPDGEDQLSNPYALNPATDKGKIGFHCAGGMYRIRVTSPSRPGWFDEIDWVPIGTLASFDFGEAGLLTFDWDAVVPNIAGRQTYDGKPKGFSVLVENDAAHDHLPIAYYKLSDVGGDVPGATGTATGNLTGGGGLAAAFDGTTAQGNAAVAALLNSAVDGTIGKDWGAGTPRVISKVTLYGPSDAAIARNTANAAASVNAKLQGSNDNAAWTDLATVATGTTNAAVITFSPVSTTAYRYHRILLPAADASSDRYAAEVVFHQAGDWSSGLVFAAARLKAGLTLRFDGDGNIIQTGVAHSQPVPFPGVITGWRLTTDGEGSISIDVRQSEFDDWPSSESDSITNDNPASVSGANKAEDTALSGWGTTLHEGSMLDFVVLECENVTEATLTLFVRRT